MNQTTMDYKLILYLCICGVVCYPSKPLDDRPSELAWQAWLLVDSQNSQEGDRRITPKSVFIAPNINGDSGSNLPECAEGYRSDPMGRCIKFVKVDEAAHLDFLLQRLNAMYATRPTHDLDDESKPTSGPLQVNIPLGGGRFPVEDEPKDPEIAIIVAPTNGNFDSDEKEVKFDKRNKPEAETTTLPTTESTVTTIKEDITTITDTTTITETTTTLSDDLQALFFLVPNNKTDHVQKNRTDDISKVTTTEEINTNNPELSEEDETDNSTPFDEAVKTNLQAEFSVKDSAIFERAPEVVFPASSERNTVRFPDYEHLKLTPEAHRLSSGEIEHLFKEYISQKPDLVALTSTDHIRRRPVSEEAYLDEITTPQIQRPYYNPHYNHRNRDKSDFWRPSSAYREEPVQQPLVLRFNRHHPYSQERNSGDQARFYEDRPQEFAYARKRRRGNLR